MTPSDNQIVRALCAIAWADGQMEGTEGTVIEGLLAGFDASETEEADILEWSKTRRTLDDVVLSDMSREDRELLLGNAALLTHADGTQSKEELTILADLSERLGFSMDEAFSIIESVRGGSLSKD